MPVVFKTACTIKIIRSQADECFFKKGQVHNACSFFLYFVRARFLWYNLSVTKENQGENR